jgi:hypothetical protein
MMLLPRKSLRVQKRIIRDYLESMNGQASMILSLRGRITGVKNLEYILKSDLRCGGALDGVLDRREKRSRYRTTCRSGDRIAELNDLLLR